MTTAELAKYYVSLLILQYLGKPKSAATVEAVVTPVLMGLQSDPNAQLPLAVQDAFNITGSNPAVGAQLDILGKYAGASRSGSGFNGPITLDDSDYIALIRMAIVKNNAGSSLATILQLLNQSFPDQILVFDYQNMHMSYLISSSIGSFELIQLFVNEGFLPKPMGVQLASVIYVPTINAFFGMTEYSLYSLTGQIQPNATPFNSYISYHMNWPWLSYTDAVGKYYQQDLTTEAGDILTTEGGIGLGLE
jgi:hypothetical protein